MLDLSLFEQLGINKKQAKVYLAALEFGPTTIANLAKKSGVKRTTIHEFIDEMITRGILIKTIKSKRKLYNAIPAEQLNNLIAKQKQAIDLLLPELKLLSQTKPQLPKIRLYEGREGIKQIYNDFLNYQDIDMYYFGSMKEITTLIGKDFMENWLKKRIQKKIRSHAIRIKSKELGKDKWGAGKKHLREVKYFPFDISEDITHIILFENKVVIVSALGESYGLIIESHQLYITLKAIWQAIWGISKLK